MNPQSYLPELTTKELMQMVENESLQQTYMCLERQRFERIGLDRLYYILYDISTNYGRYFGFNFLDVGCNNGLISNCLAAYNNQVVGVDNAAIDGQHRYAPLTFTDSNEAQLLSMDIKEFCEKSSQDFDFVLLLSVAHQWEFGYAHSGCSNKNIDEITWIIDTLIGKAKRAVYYECPVNEPGFEEHYGISFLSRYATLYPKLSIVKVAETVASNGYIRYLYRIVLSQTPSNLTNTDNNLMHQNIMRGLSKVNNDTLRVSILPKIRTEQHPLGRSPDFREPHDLWQMIKINEPRNVQHIINVYEDNTADIVLLKGISGMNTPDIPKWKLAESFSVNTEKIEYTFHNVLKWLSDLALGLHDLHQLGIAHGDPYPYNVILSEAHATWVDLGNITDDKSSAFTDIFVFMTYTTITLLHKTNFICDEFIDNLEKATQGSTSSVSLLASLYNVFCEKYYTVREKKDADIVRLSSVISKIVLHALEEDGTKSYLPVYNAYYYFKEYVLLYNEASYQKQSRLFLERAISFSNYESNRLRISNDEAFCSHQKLQIEMDSLKHSRQTQIETLQKQIKELQETQVILSQQIYESQQALSDKNKCIEQLQQQFCNSVQTILELEEEQKKQLKIVHSLKILLEENDT